MRSRQPKQQLPWLGIMWPSVSSSRKPASLLAPSGETWDFFLTLPSQPSQVPHHSPDLHSGPGYRSQLKMLHPLPTSHCRSTPTAPLRPSRSR